jgi:colanic acid/amylovoran biosynthesis glycosyltransferase
VRIIYVTSSLPYGKVEAFIIPEIEELKKRGHEVLIVPMYPRGALLHGDARPFLAHTVTEPLLSLGMAKVAAKKVRQFPIKALKVLGWLLRSRGVKVLFKNLVIYPKGLWLANVADELKADHIHAHWAATTATMALVASEVSGVPWSVTAHRWDIPENNLLSLKAKRACFVRAISQRGAKKFASYLNTGVPPPSVLHMGVRIPPTMRKDRSQDGYPFRIVVAANLLEVKGHTYLLEATKLLKERNTSVQVDVAGEGPLRDNLARKARELGLNEQVTLLGAVPHEELLERLETGVWDMLALPSIVVTSDEQEGIPVALIEAMGRRVPVVSTTTGGITELLGDIPGSLVPPKNPSALAEAIERLIREPELRNRLVDAGYKRVEENFAIEKVVSELVQRFEACGVQDR